MENCTAKVSDMSMKTHTPWNSEKQKVWEAVMNSPLKIKHAYKNGTTHTPQHWYNETKNHKTQVSQY